MRRFQRSRRTLGSRPRRQPRQVGVPQVIWNTATDLGMIKFTEPCVSTYAEDFTVLTDLGAPCCTVRVAAGQTNVVWGNMNMTRVTAGAILDGYRLVNMTTRGGIRGPEGLTVGPFGCRITVTP